MLILKLGMRFISLYLSYLMARGGEEKAGQDQRPVCFVWTEDGPGEVAIVDCH
jgi:hypothetical protein